MKEVKSEYGITLSHEFDKTGQNKNKSVIKPLSLIKRVKTRKNWLFNRGKKMVVLIKAFNLRKCYTPENDNEHSSIHEFQSYMT